MKRLLYLTGIIALTAIACTEKIEIDLNDDENSRLVVEGYISTEQKAHKIKLTRTSSYFANRPAPRETGATVSLNDGYGVYNMTENQSEEGIYETPADFFGRAGRTYTLEIVTKDGEEYNSSCYLDTVCSLDSLSFYYEPNPYYEHFGGEPGYYIFSLWAQEPPGKGNNYMFNVYLADEEGNWVWDNDTLREAVYESDEYFDGIYLDGLDFYYIGQSEIDRDSILVRVDMLSVPLALIDYNYAVMYETDWQGGMFASIPANVPSNISNGALGFFYASDVSSMQFFVYRVHE